MSKTFPIVLKNKDGLLQIVYKNRSEFYSVKESSPLLKDGDPFKESWLTENDKG